MALDFVPTIIDFEAWMKGRNLSDSSIYVYSSAVKKFLINTKEIDTIDAYNEFIFEHAIKKRSNYVYDALKLFIKFYFDKNPKMNSLLRNLLKPKVQDPKKNIRYLDDETRVQIIKLMTNYKHRVMAKMQNVVGVRAGDILRLKRGSVSYEAYEDKTIVMRIDFEGKGRRHFVKWIFDEDVQTQIDLFIKSNILDSEYYFLERLPNKSLDRSFKRNYNKYLKDLKQALHIYGIEYKEWATHDFRRSFARNVWTMTKDPVVLKEMLNHQQFDTTLRYLRGSGLQVKDVYAEMNTLKKKEDE